MTRDDVMDETLVFIRGVLPDMSDIQMWTAMSFILGAALRRTPDDVAPQVLDHLIRQATDIASDDDTTWRLH